MMCKCVGVGKVMCQCVGVWKVMLVVSKKPGPEARFGPGSARWALARPKPKRPKLGPSPLKGGPSCRLHFRPGPARWAGPNHGLLGPPRSPFRGSPRGPPRGSSKSPSRGPLKSPPKSPSPPRRFFFNLNCIQKLNKK